MFKKTNKHSNGLQRKVSWILHTCAQTYMAANKICTISFDHDAKGTESLELIKKIMAIWLGNMFCSLVKHECFSCSRN